MSLLAKLLGILSLSRAVSSSSHVVERMLNGMAAILGLTLVSALLIGVLFVGSMFLVYDALLAHGLDSDAAYIVVGGMIAAVAISLILITLHLVRKLRSLPEQLIYAQAPLARRASSVADAFIDGLLTSETRL